MKQISRRSVASMISGLGLAAAIAAIPSSGAGAATWDREHEHFSCSNETLRGDYGFTLTGTRPSMPGGPQVSVVGVAMTTFNGDGTLTQTDNVHADTPTPPFVPDRPGTGFYSLNPDCSGSMSLTAGGMTLTLSIVVVDHGREVRTAVISPNVFVTSIGRKI